MSSFSLEAFDSHIENLRTQLQFLNGILSDHNAPDWVATDLVSLRNKSGRLQDDMQKFRDQLDNEGLGQKTSNKRLSLEAAKPTGPNVSTPKEPQPSSSSHVNSPSMPTTSKDEYEGQHVDVSEEVNRRLHESRLRRLMNSPSTAQKRKYDAFEDTRMGSGGDTEDDREELLDRDRSPTKRLRASGTFESVLLKRKESGLSRADSDERNGEKANFKRRKMWTM